MSSILYAQKFVVPNGAFKEYVVSSDGKRGWKRQQGVRVPGNSIVQIYSPSGQIFVGKQAWLNDPVDATGHFYKTDRYEGPSTKDFVLEGINKFCMLVRVGNVTLINRSLAWGSSFSGLNENYQIGINDGGDVYTSFNDNDDSDNSNNVIQMILRVYPV